MNSRKIKGYEDYSISEYGEVISYKIKSAGKVLKCGPNNANYKTVTLTNKNRQAKTMSIHQLVAKNFADLMDTEYEEGLELDHIDEDKTNNHYSNLRWCTSKQNTEYHYENNPHKRSKGPTVYIPVDPVIKARNKKAALEKLSIDNAKKYGVSIVVNGITYDAVRQAARYIVGCEDALGNIRNIETVRKELKRFIQGKRPAWTMYGNYTIGS